MYDVADLAPRCPRCSKAVYFGEKVTAVGKDWHRSCFRCHNEDCNIVLTAGKEAEHDGKPYCARCHQALFGPRGYGRGGVESHVFCGGKTGGVGENAILTNGNRIDSK